MSRVIYSTERIQELAVKRVLQFDARNQLYDRFFSYYLGMPAAGGGGNQVKIADSKGRPLLRDLGFDGGYNKSWYVNKIAPIVEDYQALIGRVPRVRVDPPGIRDADSAEHKAELQTKYLLSTYELSEMDRQQAEAGLYLPLLGDCAYVLEVAFHDEDKPAQGGRVAISVLNPRYGYPSFLKGFRRHQLYDLIIAYYEDEETLEREYGFTAKDREDTLLVTYLSPWQRTVVVGKQQLAHVEHDLGFCPAEWCFNKVVGSGGIAEQYAHSEIRNVMALQDHQNATMQIANDALIYQTYPIIHMKNADAFTEDQVEFGPGSITPSREDGEIVAVPTQATVTPAMQMISAATHDIYIGSGTTSVRTEGEQEHSSIATGKALHASQGPQATRIDLKQAVMSAILERVNHKAMEMQEKVEVLKKPFEIYGRMHGKEFREDFDPERDIDGWYQNHVTWDTLVGSNMQTRLVTAMQGMAASIGDDLWGREVAGIEDPIGMRDRVETWKLSEAKMQADIGAMQQAGANPAPGGAMEPKPGVPNVSFPRGGPGGASASPPKKPLAMSQDGGGASVPPPSLPKPVTSDAIESALHGIASKLRGSVFLAPDFVQGQTDSPLLYISDPRDHEIVTAALRAIAPRGRVKAMSEEAMPEQALRVS